MIYKVIFGKKYKYLGESGDEEELNKIFKTVPSVDEIVKPFKIPCPLTIQEGSNWLGVPTDIWGLKGNIFTTISCYRTQLEYRDEEVMEVEDEESSGVRKLELDAKEKFIEPKVIEMDPIDHKLLCAMQPAAENCLPVGIIVISNYDPATNYQHFRDVLTQLVEKKWPELKNSLSEGRILQGWEEAPIKKTANKEYPKIAVEPVATWAVGGSDDNIISPLLKPVDSGDDFLLYLSEMGRDYLQNLVNSSERLMSINKTDNYVIEIDGYIASDEGIHTKFDKSEIKYAIVVGHNPNSDYQAAGMILKMSLCNSNRYTIASVINEVKKGVATFRKLDLFDSWSNQMFEKVKRASRDSINHTAPYDSVMPKTGER